MSGLTMLRLLLLTHFALSAKCQDTRGTRPEEEEDFGALYRDLRPNITRTVNAEGAREENDPFDGGDRRPDLLTSPEEPDGISSATTDYDYASDEFVTTDLLTSNESLLAVKWDAADAGEEKTKENSVRNQTEETFHPNVDENHKNNDTETANIDSVESIFEDLKENVTTSEDTIEDVDRIFSADDDQYPTAQISTVNPMDFHDLFAPKSFDKSPDGSTENYRVKTTEESNGDEPLTSPVVRTYFSEAPSLFNPDDSVSHVHFDNSEESSGDEPSTMGSKNFHLHEGLNYNTEPFYTTGSSGDVTEKKIFEDFRKDLEYEHLEITNENGDNPENTGKTLGPVTEMASNEDESRLEDVRSLENYFEYEDLPTSQTNSEVTSEIILGSLTTPVDNFGPLQTTEVSSEIVGLKKDSVQELHQEHLTTEDEQLNVMDGETKTTSIHNSAAGSHMSTTLKYENAEAIKLTTDAEDEPGSSRIFVEYNLENEEFSSGDGAQQNITEKQIETGIEDDLRSTSKIFEAKASGKGKVSSGTGSVITQQSITEGEKEMAAFGTYSDITYTSNLGTDLPTTSRIENTESLESDDTVNLSSASVTDLQTDTTETIVGFTTKTYLEDKSYRMPKKLTNFAQGPKGIIDNSVEKKNVVPESELHGEYVYTDVDISKSFDGTIDQNFIEYGEDADETESASRRIEVTEQSQIEQAFTEEKFPSPKVGEEEEKYNFDTLGLVGNTQVTDTSSSINEEYFSRKVETGVTQNEEKQYLTANGETEGTEEPVNLNSYDLDKSIPTESTSSPTTEIIEDFTQERQRTAGIGTVPIVRNKLEDEFDEPSPVTKKSDVYVETTSTDLEEKYLEKEKLVLSTAPDTTTALLTTEGTTNPNEIQTTDDLIRSTLKDFENKEEESLSQTELTTMKVIQQFTTQNKLFKADEDRERNAESTFTRIVDGITEDFTERRMTQTVKEVEDNNVTDANSLLTTAVPLVHVEDTIFRNEDFEENLGYLESSAGENLKTEVTQVEEPLINDPATSLLKNKIDILVTDEIFTDKAQTESVSSDLNNAKRSKEEENITETVLNFKDTLHNPGLTTTLHEDINEESFSVTIGTTSITDVNEEDTPARESITEQIVTDSNSKTKTDEDQITTTTTHEKLSEESLEKDVITKRVLKSENEPEQVNTMTTETFQEKTDGQNFPADIHFEDSLRKETESTSKVDTEADQTNTSTVAPDNLEFDSLSKEEEKDERENTILGASVFKTEVNLMTSMVPHDVQEETTTEHFSDEILDHAEEENSEKGLEVQTTEVTEANSYLKTLENSRGITTAAQVETEVYLMTTTAINTLNEEASEEMTDKEIVDVKIPEDLQNEKEEERNEETSTVVLDVTRLGLKKSAENFSTTESRKEVEAYLTTVANVLKEEINEEGLNGEIAVNSVPDTWNLDLKRPDDLKNEKEDKSKIEEEWSTETSRGTSEETSTVTIALRQFSFKKSEENVSRAERRKAVETEAHLTTTTIPNVVDEEEANKETSEITVNYEIEDKNMSLKTEVEEETEENFAMTQFELNNSEENILREERRKTAQAEEEENMATWNSELFNKVVVETNGRFLNPQLESDEVTSDEEEEEEEDEDFVKRILEDKKRNENVQLDSPVTSYVKSEAATEKLYTVSSSNHPITTSIFNNSGKIFAEISKQIFQKYIDVATTEENILYKNERATERNYIIADEDDQMIDDEWMQTNGFMRKIKTPVTYRGLQNVNKTSDWEIVFDYHHRTGADVGEVIVSQKRDVITRESVDRNHGKNERKFNGTYLNLDLCNAWNEERKRNCLTTGSLSISITFDDFTTYIPATAGVSGSCDDQSHTVDINWVVNKTASGLLSLQLRAGDVFYWISSVYYQINVPGKKHVEISVSDLVILLTQIGHSMQGTINITSTSGLQLLIRTVDLTSGIVDDCTTKEANVLLEHELALIIGGAALATILVLAVAVFLLYKKLRTTASVYKMAIE